MEDGFVRALIALVAVGNVLPILPLVTEYTSDMAPGDARAFQSTALLQGSAVGLGFMLFAPFLLDALSLTVNDLRIAGGVVLVAYATHDLLFSTQKRKERETDDTGETGAAIAPLGVPILVGPATLSLLIVLTEVHGLLIVAMALGVNVLVNLLILAAGQRIVERMGEGASQAIGKVMSLLLATLGAGMLRAGIAGAFG